MMTGLDKDAIDGFFSAATHLGWRLTELVAVAFLVGNYAINHFCELRELRLKKKIESNQERAKLEASTRELEHKRKVLASEFEEGDN